MKTVPEQLADFLKANAGQKYASGILQRMEWKNKDGTLSTPRSIARRLEEMVEDKILNVVYGEKNHAYYSWGNPVKKVQSVEYVMRDGVRFAHLTQITVPV